MRLLKLIDERLARIEGILLALFLFAMILLAFLQVLSRNLFATGILWADAIVRALVLWIGLLGATLATQRGQHLGIDVLTKFVGGRFQKGVGVFVKLFAAAVSLLLLKASINFVQFEREAGSEFFRLLPYWVVELVIPITFILIPFHFLVGILSDLSILLGRARVK